MAVKEEYAGSSVLVTGATGFLGAILVERLIASCPTINTVYVLIRTRNGKNPKDRLKALLDQPLFKALDIDYKSKVTIIPGDICKDGLGLSDDDKNLLIKNVSYVFHVAANINFNAKLATAIGTNILGTRRILQLAKEMPNIKSFVYMSTAYCNCVQRDMIAEKIYPSRWSPQELIDLLAIPLDEIKKRSKSIIGGHPNTYSFTKLVAENLIQEERGNIPIAIIRPSVVLGTLGKPMNGWVDNVNNGAMAFIAGAGRGVFRTVLADANCVADLVPADQLAHLTIAAAAKQARTKGLDVYHFTSGILNPITWGEYVSNVIDGIIKTPCLKPVFYPRCKCRSSVLRNKIFVIFCHYFPAIIIDFFAYLRGEPQILMGIQEKYTRGMDHTMYFTSHNFEFSTKNTEKLLNEIGDEKDALDFDVRRIHWQHYMESCVLGVRHFYHKNPENSIASARNSQKVMFLIDNVFWSLLTLGLCFVVSMFIDSSSTAVLVATAIVIFFRWL